MSKFNFLLFSVGILFFSASCKKKQIEVEGTSIAKIAMVEKDVKRRLNRRIDWNNVDLNSNLYQKDSIRTLQGSRAGIEFEDGASIIIEENSLMVIERPDKSEEGVDAKITLQEGTFNQVVARGDFGKKFVTAVTMDKVTAFITTDTGEVGIKKSNDRLKIAVFSGKTRIKSSVESEDLSPLPEDQKNEVRDSAIEPVEKSDSLTNLIEIAVYGEAEARISLQEDSENKDQSSGEKKKKRRKSILIKPNQVMHIRNDNLPSTKKPILNLKSINIMKEDFEIPEPEKKDEFVKPIDVIDIPIVEPKKIKKIEPVKIPTLDLSKPKIIAKRIPPPKPKKPAKIEFKKRILKKNEPQIERIEWKKDKAVKIYIVDISADEFFMKIIKTTTVKDNFIDVDIKDLKPGKYYWRKAPVKGDKIFEYERQKPFFITE